VKRRTKGTNEFVVGAKGKCLCGAVQFEIELPTLFCAHCHCSMCRRMHGAGFVTWFAVPYSRFRMVAGNDNLMGYRSSDHGTRRYSWSITPRGSSPTRR
jgi:hypothetical protein